MHASDQLDVLATRGKAIESRSLHGESEPPPHFGRLPRDVEPGDAGHTAGGDQEGREDADGGGLAGAVGTQKTKKLSRLDVKADAVNRPCAAWIDLGQLLDFDDRPSHCSTPFRMTSPENNT